MGENDGVEPSSKNHGGVDQMQNAFETPPFLRTDYGRLTLLPLLVSGREKTLVTVACGSAER